MMFVEVILSVHFTAMMPQDPIVSKEQTKTKYEIFN